LQRPLHEAVQQQLVLFRIDLWRSAVAAVVVQAARVMMPSSDSMGASAEPDPGASSPYARRIWRTTGCSKREGWP